MPSTILLVDSYDGSRLALTELLREDGYEVVEAHNGLEAVLAVRGRQPDLIVIDPWPFVAASMQLVARLRQGDDGERTPVLMLTSSTPAVRRALALMAHCDGQLEKGCEPAGLLAEIGRILGGAEAPGPLVMDEAPQA